MSAENRVPKFKLENGLQIYEVKLVGGPMDGTKSLCSHDTVYSNGNLYLRGPDDLYHYTPQEDK